MCSIDAWSAEFFVRERILLLALLRVWVCFMSLAIGSIFDIVFFEALAFVALSVSKHAVVESLQTHRTVSNIIQVVKAAKLNNAMRKCRPSTLCKYLTDCWKKVVHFLNANSHDDTAAADILQQRFALTSESMRHKHSRSTGHRYLVVNVLSSSLAGD